MRAWIVGSGGMLGSALVARAADTVDLFDAGPIPWADPTAAQETLRSAAQRFAAQVSTGDPRWAVVWAAGSSVVASSTAETAPELATMQALVETLRDAPTAGHGVFFLTSSAGGVYAGSGDPPFDATTPPRPISPYGELKLAQEEAAVAALRGVVPVVIGRLSNLYGPGQNSDKGQGLIPALCRATIRRMPLNLYVAMDTVRDYLYVDDAAAFIWATVDDVLDVPTSPMAGAAVRVIASGQPTTVAEVIATVQTVAHRRVPLALGTDPSSRHQAADLRLIPGPGLTAAPVTSLPAGVKLVFDSMLGGAA